MSTLALIACVLAAGVTLSVLLTGAWAVQQRTGNARWIDCGWTMSVGSTGVAGALLPVTDLANASRKWAIAILVAVWCLRLGSHLLQRALRGLDDPRYAALRKQWGAGAGSQMFWFAQSQAMAAVPLVLAVLLAANRPGNWPDWQDLAGLGLLAAGIAGAGISDWQLRRFSTEQSHRGKVCDAGLWRWSRHPNYFFEWLGWVGIAVVALDVTSAYGFGWLAFLAPVLMYVLLVHVSGIPPLEEHMLRTREVAFRTYQKKTSRFFPWPPGF